MPQTCLIFKVSPQGYVVPRGPIITLLVNCHNVITVNCHTELPLRIIVKPKHLAKERKKERKKHYEGG